VGLATGKEKGEEESPRSREDPLPSASPHGTRKLAHVIIEHACH